MMTDQTEKRNMRNEERMDAKQRGTIRKTGGLKIPGTLVNAAPAGFCMDSAFSGRVGETYFIRFPGLESQAATLQWSNNNLHGFALEAPLHPVVLERLCGTEGTIEYCPDYRPAQSASAAYWAANNRTQFARRSVL